MQALSGVIERLGLTVPETPELNPLEFQALPPTDLLTDRLADLVARRPSASTEVQNVADIVTGTQAQRLEDDIRRTERDLRLAAKRDAIAATRPEGCWCFGAGGAEARYTQEGTQVLSRYCPCEDGIARRETDDAIRREAQIRISAARTKRLFADAKVPRRFQDCTLESYPVSDDTRDAVQRVRLWAIGPDLDDAERYPTVEAGNAALNAWRAGPKSLLLHGPYGTGKTGLAVGLLHFEAELENAGLFFTVPSLLDAIRATYGPNPEHQERDVIEAVKNAPFLVLDDLGAERVTDWVREKLFTVINHRHDEDLRTVFTSNLDVPALAEHIGERTAWRIVEMCEVVELVGPNLRDRRAA